MAHESTPAAAPKSIWRTTVTILGTVAATIAAVAAVINNSKTVGNFILDRLEPLIQAQAVFTVKLDPKAEGVLHVNVMGKAGDSHPIAQDRVEPGKSVSLKVPAKALYVIFWEGGPFKAAAIEQVSADGPRAWTLTVKEKGEDGVVLQPVEDASGETVSTAAAPAAGLIAGASVSAPGAGAPAISVPQLVPELDRALATVGLFEVGSTDCVARTYASDFDLGAGCLAAAVPGPLAGLLKALDAKSPGLLDQAFAADVATLRAIIASDSIGDQRTAFAAIKGDRVLQGRLKEGLARVATSIEFRSAYQALVADYYARALQIARELHLKSERGVLFAFDRIINQGTSWLTRTKADYLAQEKAIAPGDDRQRLALLGGLVKAKLQESPFKKNIDRRIDTIVSGQGELRGIAFNLDEIGIRYGVPIVSDTTAVAPAMPVPAVCRATTFDRVKALVVEHLGSDPTAVTEDASFIDDLGADDLDVVELVMAMEEATGCEISDDAAKSIVKVKDAVAVIDAAAAKTAN